jgi:hypothetical protein
MRMSMRNTFRHRRIEVFIEQLDEETFLLGFTLQSQDV